MFVVCFVVPLLWAAISVLSIFVFSGRRPAHGFALNADLCCFISLDVLLSCLLLFNMGLFVGILKYGLASAITCVVVGATVGTTVVEA